MEKMKKSIISFSLSFFHSLNKYWLPAMRKMFLWFLFYGGELQHWQSLEVLRRTQPLQIYWGKGTATLHVQPTWISSDIKTETMSSALYPSLKAKSYKINQNSLRRT